MAISAVYLAKALDRFTSDQCLELLHHSTDEYRTPRDQAVARAMFYGIRPVKGGGTLYLLEREGLKYRLLPDGMQVKAAVEARA